MKNRIRLLCMLISALLLFPFAVQAEQAPADILETLDGMVFDFSSGVGGWFTSLAFSENGAFTGQYHDSEMGETGETYPDGTVYGCLFHGTLADPQDQGDGIFKLTLSSLEPDEGQLPEAIEDNIRYVTSAPYGLEKASELFLYTPGTPVEKLPEAFLSFSHLSEIAPDADTLPYYGLYSAADESGFISIPEETAPALGLANPWIDVSQEELSDMTGVLFGLPEGAEAPLYRVLNGNALAEMQFDLNGMHCTARVAAADAFTDISGLYYDWTGRESFNLEGCVATWWTAQGAEELQLCLWYDRANGLMYSLCADGKAESADMKALCETVYIPSSGETALWLYYGMD